MTIAFRPLAPNPPASNPNAVKLSWTFKTMLKNPSKNNCCNFAWSVPKNSTSVDETLLSSQFPLPKSLLGEKSKKSLSENWKRNFPTSTSSSSDTERSCPKKRERPLPTATSKSDPFPDPSSTFTKTSWKISFFHLSSSESESSTRPTTNLSSRLS